MIVPIEIDGARKAITVRVRFTLVRVGDAGEATSLPKEPESK